MALRFSAAMKEGYFRLVDTHGVLAKAVFYSEGKFQAVKSHHDVSCRVCLRRSPVQKLRAA